MPFSIIGRTGPGMRQVVGFGDRSTGRGTFGGEFGAHHCPRGLIRHTLVRLIIAIIVNHVRTSLSRRPPAVCVSEVPPTQPSEPPSKPASQRSPPLPAVSVVMPRLSVSLPGSPLPPADIYQLWWRHLVNAYAVNADMAVTQCRK